MSVLILLFPCLAVTSDPSPAPGCSKVGRCRCVLQDGAGVIDLTALGDAEGFLGRLTPVAALPPPPGVEALLSFSPCQPFSQPQDQVGTACTGVAACLVGRFQRLRRYINYGRHDGNLFHYNNSLKMLSVSYFAADHDEPPLTTVHYRCSANQTTTSSYVHALSLATDQPLQVWVDSPCACINACATGDLSLGTVLLILLCLSATAYFILSVCGLWPFYTSGGVQMAPEESVWCAPCSLCTDTRQAEQRKRTRRETL